MCRDSEVFRLKNIHRSSTFRIFWYIVSLHRDSEQQSAHGEVCFCVVIIKVVSNKTSLILQAECVL